RIEQADRLDVVAHTFLAELEHRLRRRRRGKERGRCLVDAGIGRLRRQDHGNEQLERRAEGKLRLGRGIRAGETLVDLLALRCIHRRSVSRLAVAQLRSASSAARPKNAPGGSTATSMPPNGNWISSPAASGP